MLLPCKSRVQGLIEICEDLAREAVGELVAAGAAHPQERLGAGEEEIKSMLELAGLPANPGAAGRNIDRMLAGAAANFQHLPPQVRFD